MSFNYNFAMSAACGAIILYFVKDGNLHLLTTQRSKEMGGKRSLSAGGFAEIKPMFNMKAGTIHDGRLEIYREMYEELGKQVKSIITEQDFLDRTEFIADFFIPKGGQTVNHALTYALEISEQQMEEILALPSTNEQVGKKIEVLEMNPTMNEQERADLIEKRLSDFQYPEEIRSAQIWYQKLCM